MLDLLSLRFALVALVVIRTLIAIQKLFALLMVGTLTPIAFNQRRNYHLRRSCRTYHDEVHQ